MRRTFVASLLLLACDQRPSQRSPEVEEPLKPTLRRECYASPAQREWVLSCIKANPQSDEEAEELVEQCEDTAEDLFEPECKFVQHCWRNGGERPLSECGAKEESATPSHGS